MNWKGPVLYLSSYSDNAQPDLHTGTPIVIAQAAGTVHGVEIDNLNNYYLNNSYVHSYYNCFVVCNNDLYHDGNYIHSSTEDGTTIRFIAIGQAP